MLLIRPVQIVLRSDVHQGVRLGQLGTGHGPLRRSVLRPSARHGPAWSLAGPLWSPSAADSRVRAQPDGDDAVGIGERQRTKRHGVHDGEDRGRGACAQRQHEQRTEHEAGRCPQCPDGVTQIDAHAVKRERARRTRRRRFVPVRLAQGSEKGFESGTVDLGPRHVRRLFGRGAARDELPPPILEVLREFLGDLRLTSGREAQRRQPRTDVRFPVRHVPLLSRGARPRRSRPTSGAVAPGRAVLQASADRSGADARPPSRPRFL